MRINVQMHISVYCTLVCNTLFGVFIEEVRMGNIKCNLDGIAALCFGTGRNTRDQVVFFTHGEVEIDFRTH